MPRRQPEPETGRFLGVVVDDPADWLDPEMVALRLRIHVSLVMRLVERGHLAKALNEDRPVGISRKSLIEFERNLPKPGGSPFGQAVGDVVDFFKRLFGPRELPPLEEIDGTTPENPSTK